jgi:hypothetical protein
VIAAEAATGHRHPRPAGVAARVRENLVHDHSLVGHVCLHPVGRVDGAVVPALVVDAVGAIELHPSRFDQRPGGVDELEILVLVVPRERGREKHDGVASMPEDEHLELASPQVRGVPPDILFLHSRPGA